MYFYAFCSCDNSHLVKLLGMIANSGCCALIATFTTADSLELLVEKVQLLFGYRVSGQSAFFFGNSPSKPASLSGCPAQNVLY